MSPAERIRTWHVAAVSMTAILLWWTAVVHWAYDGFWNALYCNGSAARFPAWLEEREPLYRVPSPAGYDGQWYHLLAHRPLEYRQSAAYMDWPRLRCQRLLFPLLVWLLALGQFQLVDPAFFSLMLAALGAGVYFTARLAELRGRTPLWGLAFLAMPASLGSIERMLLDGPMLAAAAASAVLPRGGKMACRMALRRAGAAVARKRPARGGGAGSRLAAPASLAPCRRLVSPQPSPRCCG